MAKMKIGKITTKFKFKIVFSHVTFFVLKKLLWFLNKWRQNTLTTGQVEEN